MGDLDRYVAAWRQTLQACLTLGESLTADQWQARTECPDWTVKDIYAHLVGGEVWMSQGHLKPDTGLARIADEPVAARRHRSGPEVLAELRDVYALRVRQLLDDPPDPQAPTFTAYLVPITVEGLLRMRAFDAWVHEQDVRRAVGVPGNLDSDGARVAAEIFVSALPRLVAKAAAAPAGSVVRFSVDGGVAFDRAVVVDDAGRGQLVTADGTATVGLRMSWETFTRLGAGRIPPAGAEVDVDGDRALATRVLQSLAITP